MESSDCTSDSDASSSKKPLRCPEKGCNASFSKNNKLTYHIRKHKGERPFACDEAGCSKTYTNSSHLRRHKKVSHECPSQSSVVCEHEGCGIILANKYSLKKHCNVKHNIDNYPFICADCSQGFHRKRQLQQHVYLHTGEAPFKCDQCEMGFTTNRNLNRHKRFHRTHTCDCGEIFNHWSDFLLHKKSCKKPRFKCEICGKLFSHVVNYKNHKVTHMNKTDRMVFVCPYTDCKRFYFYKKNIKQHINNFHKRINEDITYSCMYPRCSVKLKTKQSLKMHLQRHFNWVQKKQRRERRDKGKPKKSMISVLIGQEQPKEENDHGNETLENQSENVQRHKRKPKKSMISTSPAPEQPKESDSETATIIEKQSGNQKISVLIGQEQTKEEKSLGDKTLGNRSENVRRHKRKLKKSMISTLTTPEQPKETDCETATITEKQSENLLISLTEDVTDDVLLRQCDLTLAALNEEIIAAT